MEKQRRRRVHGEPTGWVRTECIVVFIGRAWTEQVMETRPGVPQNGGNSLVYDRPRSKRDPVHQEGLAYRKMEETNLCWTSYGRNRGPVDREGCGVPQNGGNGLVLERYARNGGPVHREGCGRTAKRDSTGYCSSPPSTASTGYCSSTVDLH